VAELLAPGTVRIAVEPFANRAPTSLTAKARRRNRFPVRHADDELH